MQDLSNDIVIHQKDKEIEYLQFRKLLEYKDKVTHAYTLKKNLDFGNNTKSKEKRPVIMESTKKICDALSLEYSSVIRPFEVHGNHVEIVDRTPNYKEEFVYSKEYIGVDGLLTDKKETALLLTASDCITIFLYDPNQNAIANLHSGWQGTLKNIAYEGVKKMVQENGCRIQDILAFIGPSIRSCHFEVHQDVKDKFFEKFSNRNQIEQIIQPIGQKEGKEKYTIDTAAIVKLELKEMGMKSNQIFDCGICTACHANLFYSYRTKKENANNAAIISLK